MKINFYLPLCAKLTSGFFLLTSINCAVLSAQTSTHLQDNLITQVSVKSDKIYTVGKLNPGVKQLIDRNYTITTVPDYLQGASFIQTANDDKLNAADSFLSFNLTADAVVYIAYDSRGTAIPEWLTDWTNTGDKIGTSDQDAVYLTIYSRTIQNEERFYPVILGGNLAGPASGAKTNYLVAAVKRPEVQQLQAEDALLSGAVVANNHGGYNGTGFADFKNPADDYIEWTVQIVVPGFYKLDFGYANASYNDRSLQITDNGNDVGTATFSALSSSWSDWAFLNDANIFLSSGAHKIRLTATGTSGPNIDELYLYYLYDYPPLTTVKKYLSRGAGADQTAGEDFKAYPNPFCQNTKIYYTLKEKAKVTLSMYTLQGQKIQVLESRIREAGNYQVTFNGDKIAKGIYLYRLQIGSQFKSAKIIKN